MSKIERALQELTEFENNELSEDILLTVTEKHGLSLGDIDTLLDRIEHTQFKSTGKSDDRQKERTNETSNINTSIDNLESFLAYLLRVNEISREVIANVIDVPVFTVNKWLSTQSKFISKFYKEKLSEYFMVDVVYFRNRHYTVEEISDFEKIELGLINKSEVEICKHKTEKCHILDLIAEDRLLGMEFLKRITFKSENKINQIRGRFDKLSRKEKLKLSSLLNISLHYFELNELTLNEINEIKTTLNDFSKSRVEVQFKDRVESPDNHEFSNQVLVKKEDKKIDEDIEIIPSNLNITCCGFNEKQTVNVYSIKTLVTDTFSFREFMIREHTVFFSRITDIFQKSIIFYMMKSVKDIISILKGDFKFSDNRILQLYVKNQMEDVKETYPLEFSILFSFLEKNIECEVNVVLGVFLTGDQNFFSDLYA